MDYPILVNEFKDAGLSLLQMIHKEHPVRVGFWMKTNYEPNWLLYIGGDWVSHTYSMAAYEIVIRAFEKLVNPEIYILNTRVIAMNDPLAKAALQFWEEYPGNSPAWYEDSRFGDTNVERVYLYPPKMIADPNATLFARHKV